MKIAFLERRRQRREAREAKAGKAEQENRRDLWRWEVESRARIAKFEAERAYVANYPALRERFILAALTGLAAAPCVLTSESAWLGRMAVERAEAAMLEAGYPPPEEYPK